MFAMFDDKSFRAVYAEHTPALYLLALRLTRNQTDAADAVQETWLRVARRPDAFTAAASPRAWLCGILINCCREQRRAIALDAEAEDPVHTATPATRLDLEAAVRSLPEGFRQVLVLHDVEGYKHDEIARLLDIESSTSRSQLARARDRLRRTLEGYDDATRG
jgi:RNA polymerase sigma-70 factor, ECF subfamily